MTTLPEAVRAVQEWGGTKQNSIPWQTAMLGDGKGTVSTGNNMCYVRLTSNSSVIEVLNLRVAPIDGLLVRIAKTPEMPLIWQVIGQADQRADENGNAGGGSLFWLPKTVTDQNVLSRLYSQAGAIVPDVDGNGDRTGDFWTMTGHPHGDQTIIGSGLVYP